MSGVKQPGPSALAVFTILSRAKRNRLEPWANARDVLLRLSVGETDLEALLPDRWDASHPEHVLEHRLDESGRMVAARCQIHSCVARLRHEGVEDQRPPVRENRRGPTGCLAARHGSRGRRPELGVTCNYVFPGSKPGDGREGALVSTVTNDQVKPQRLPGPQEPGPKRSDTSGFIWSKKPG